jgi:hypothetical protein
MKPERLLALFTASVLLSFPCFAEASKPYVTPPYNYQPPNGVIPDQATAIVVAEAILKPIYGADKIKEEEPFAAVLKEDVWTVNGTFHSKGKYSVGGTAEIKISKSNGCVINISHGM